MAHGPRSGLQISTTGLRAVKLTSSRESISTLPITSHSTPRPVSSFKANSKQVLSIPRIAMSMPLDSHLMLDVEGMRVRRIVIATYLMPRGVEYTPWTGVPREFEFGTGLEGIFLVISLLGHPPPLIGARYLLIALMLTGQPDFDFYPTTSGSIAPHFNDHQIIFDMTFCGDWAGSVYSTSGCPSTCTDFVANNPSAFTDHYFGINSLAVYQAS